MPGYRSASPAGPEERSRTTPRWRAGLPSGGSRRTTCLREQGTVANIATSAAASRWLESLERSVRSVRRPCARPDGSRVTLTGPGRGARPRRGVVGARADWPRPSRSVLPRPRGDRRLGYRTSLRLDGKGAPSPGQGLADASDATATSVDWIASTARWRSRAGDRHAYVRRQIDNLYRTLGRRAARSRRRWRRPGARARSPAHPAHLSDRLRPLAGCHRARSGDGADQRSTPETRWTPALDVRSRC